MRTDWPTDQEVPSFLVASTPMMLEHYRAFGDVLFFDSYKIISHTGKSLTAGHFSVNDKNARVLLAGVAIYSASDVSSVLGILQEFFAVQDNHLPRTIVTNCETGYRQITDRMNAMGVRYLLNPNTVLKGLARKKKDRVPEDIMNQVRYALTVRNPVYQHELVLELEQHPEVRKAMRENPYLFYSTSEDPYLGLRRDNHEELKEHFKFYFVEILRPFNLLSRSHLLSERLFERTKDREICKVELDKTFDDEGLLEVRLRLEREPLERFMENYQNTLHSSVVPNQFGVEVQEHSIS